MIRRFLLISLLLLSTLTAQAQGVTDQTQLVARAASTMDSLRSNADRKAVIDRKLATARAVLIIPDLVKGGFFFGAEYGTGVLLTKGRDGLWSGPAFYTVTSGSFGLQIGLQDADTVFIIMSDSGLSAIMNDEMKLGTAANIALVSIGAGAEADTTTNTGADIYAFSSSAGLYAGVSLHGSGILPRASWNSAYYGQPVSPEDIVIRRRVDNPQSNRLRDVLSR